jgi:hypothetical protein
LRGVEPRARVTVASATGAPAASARWISLYTAASIPVIVPG